MDNGSLSHQSPRSPHCLIDTSKGGVRDAEYNESFFAETAQPDPRKTGIFVSRNVYRVACNRHITVWGRKNGQRIRTLPSC